MAQRTQTRKKDVWVISVVGLRRISIVTRPSNSIPAVTLTMVQSHLPQRTSSLPVMNLILAETICMTVSISASVRGAYIRIYSAGRSGRVPKERKVIADDPEKAWRWPQPDSITRLPSTHVNTDLQTPSQRTENIQSAGASTACSE